MKNRIGWCNLTWNPVWGCRNKCPYCYARTIAKRFWKQSYMEEIKYQFKLHPDWALTGDQLAGLKDFAPTWLDSKYAKKFPRKPQRIFVGSMSEIHHWEQRWMEVVLGRILCYPQHTFIFLTKNPEVYRYYSFSKNCWLGVTITGNKYYGFEYEKFKISNPDNLKFVCFEPLLDSSSINLEGIDWVIIGAETGSRKGKVVPKRKWLRDIVVYCHLNKIPFYIKDNLSNYYDEYRGYKEFPTIKKI